MSEIIDFFITKLVSKFELQVVIYATCSVINGYTKSTRTSAIKFGPYVGKWECVTEKILDSKFELQVGVFLQIHLCSRFRLIYCANSA